MSQKVTAEMVKELRERTGVGMGKCKEALDQAGGDMQLAIDNLRKAGMASAVKKEGRETKEGLVGYGETAHAVSLIEVNSETDFVTQNEKFKKFLAEVALVAAEKQPKSLEALLAEKSHQDPSISVDQYRALVVQSLGENIQIKRFLVLPKSANLSIGVYSHMAGKIVTAVDLAGAKGQEGLAREIAMHVAAESPDFLRPEDVPSDVKAREEDIARSQVQGKPPQITEKIVEGKIKAFYDQTCLVCQKFIKDQNLTIAQLLEKEGKGHALHIRSFVRWKVGE